MFRTIGRIEKKLRIKKINDFVKQGIKFLGIKRKLIIPLIVPTEY